MLASKSEISAADRAAGEGNSLLAIENPHLGLILLKHTYKCLEKEEATGYVPWPFLFTRSGGRMKKLFFVLL